MENYAGTDDKDMEIATELREAGITVHDFEWFRRSNREVKTSIFGELHGWSFKRAWVYWVAEGPGIPPEYANKIHETHGEEVRVDGHCGCPSPLEWFKGFGVGHYHIDTQEGLNELAKIIKSVYNDATGGDSDGD